MLGHLSDSLIKKEAIIIDKVFVSYSRKNRDFAKALYKKLDDMGFDLWQDVHDIPADSHDWWQSITDAIDNCHTMILLMSLPALKSSVVSDEWFYARLKGKRVIPVVADDIWEHPEVKEGLVAIPNWMQRRNWMDFRAKEPDAESAWANLIDTLNSRYEPKHFINMVPQLPPNFVRRAEEIEGAVRALVNDNQDAVAMTTALRGAGGYGKTTLAKAIARDIRVTGAFDDGILFVSMGEELLKLSPEALKNALIERIRSLIVAIDGAAPSLDTLEIAQAKLAEAIGDRYILLLIDDVWDASHLEPFLVKGKHCACLITTRDDTTIRRPDIARQVVDKMRPTEARELLGASFDAQELREHQAALESLAKGMRYYPLLLALGNDQIVDYVRVQRMMLGDAIKRSYERLQRKGALGFDDEDSRSRHRAVKLTLELSLELLSPKNRERYQQLAIFPEDAYIPLSSLALYWQIDEFDTEDIAAAFYRRALLQSYEFGKVRIHDIFRDCIRRNLEDAQLKNLHERLLSAYKLAEQGQLLSLPDEYAWRNLAYHLSEAGQLDRLKTFLLHFPFLEAKLKQSDCAALIVDCDYLLSEPLIALLHSALTMSNHILNEDAKQLAFQLYGRLLGHKSLNTEIAAFLEQIQHYVEKMPNPYLLPLYPTMQQAGGALIRRLVGHEHFVNAVAIQGEFAISASSDQSLIVWNWQTGKFIRRLEGHSHWVNAVVIQGNYMISASDDQGLIVWNWQTGKLIRKLEGHRSAVNALALQGNFVISASSDQTLIIWNWQTGQLVRALKGHTASVNAVVMQENYAISASNDQSLIVWNWQTGQLVRRLKGHSDSVNAIAIQGNFAISASADKSLIVWNWQTGRPLRILEGHSDWVKAVAIQGDHAISTSDDQCPIVWNWQTGELVRSLKGHSSLVNAIAIQGDHAISASSDKSLIVWNWQTGELNESFKGHRDSVNAIAAQDDTLISCSRDKSLIVWNWQTGELVHTLKGHGNQLTAVVMQGDISISASNDQSLIVWNWQTGQATRRLEGHNDWVKAVAMKDEIAISASNDQSLIVWNWQTGQFIRALKGHRASVNALVMQDEIAISASNDQSLIVWNWQTGKLLHTLDGHSSLVTSVVMQGDTAISASYDKSLLVWNWQTGQATCRLEGHSALVNALAMQDEIAISVSSDKSLILWNWRSGKALQKIFMDAPLYATALTNGLIAAGDNIGNVHFFRANSALRQLLAWE